MVNGVIGNTIKYGSSDVQALILSAARSMPVEDISARASLSSDEKAVQEQKIDVSVAQSILDITVTVLLSALNIVNIAGCRPAEPANPYADPSIPEAIGNSVKKAGQFKDAQGHVKGAEVYMKKPISSSNDGGLYMIFNDDIGGNEMSFSYSGSSTEHVTMQFICKYDEDTNPYGDDVLSSEWLFPEEAPHSITLKIPERTDKIVIMHVGSGTSEILMTHTILEFK